MFLPAVIWIYFIFDRHYKIGSYWLLLASIIFYVWNDLRALPVLIASVIINYLFGILLSGSFKRSKFILTLGLIFNIGLLGFYKYAKFFAENVNYLTGCEIPVINIIMPAGISFFTITQIVYLVDCYQGVTNEKNIFDYALFVTFFPHLLSGPIYQHKNISKQFKNAEAHKINWENISKGITLFIIGLAKKVFIADSFTTYVAQGFNNPAGLTLINGWLCAVCFTIQLYFDFSGYSDMAVGISRVMNINIPVNFNSPYKAYGIIEFWSRWHISLTNTITNYIYTPIVMSFKKITFAKAMTATFLAMLIAGIWHGAGWTFIIFGALHGIGLVFNHVWKKYKLFMPRPLGYLLTGLLILCANVFFRASSVSNALEIFRAMIGLNGVKLSGIASHLDILGLSTLLDIYLGTSGIILSRNAELIFKAVKFLLRAPFLAVLIIYFCPNSNQIVDKLKCSWRSVIMISVLLYLSLYFFNGVADFLYFQF